MINQPRFTMTEAQQGIWLSQQQLADDTVYGVAEQVLIRGKLEPELWKRAADQVLEIIPALRMYLEDGEQDFPDCVVGEPIRSGYSDYRQSNNPHARLGALIEEALADPIDCYQRMVSHAQLIQLSDDEACWFLRVHHLASDGFGFSLITQKIAENYRNLVDGRQLEDNFDQEIARMQAAHRQLGSAHSESSRDYWLSRRPDTDLVPIAPVADQLANMSAVVGTYTASPSPLHLCLASGVLAQAINRKDDAVVGVHMMARGTPELLTSVCTAQNQLPLQMKLNPNITVAQALEEVKQHWRQMSEHQGYRHESIRRDRGISASEHMVELALNIVPFGKPLSLGQAVGTAEPVWDGPADLLTIDVRMSATRGHEIVLRAPQGSCSSETLTAYATAFDSLYRALLDYRNTQDHRLLRELPLTLQEPQQEYESITQLSCISRCTDEMQGERIALIAPDRTLSANRVLEQIMGLAHLLGSGESEQMRVMILLPRISWAVLAPLATIYTGNTFIPADTAWPSQRIRTVAELSQPDIVLTTEEIAQRHKKENVFSSATTLLCLDNPSVAQQIQQLSQKPYRQAQPALEDTAYILFTSGTTGVPKGVVVRYRNLENYIRTVRDEYVPRAQKAAGKQCISVLHEHSFAFDSSLNPLVFFMLGHRLHLAEEEVLKDPRAHLDYLDRYRIDAVDIAPAVLQELIYAGLNLDDSAQGLSTVCIGGDSCPPNLWQYLHQRPRLNAINAYGPTENTVEATYAVIAEHESPSIGAAMPRQFGQVSSSWGQPCPPHLPGELYLGGESVARGYLNLTEETAAHFVATERGTLYRTGDLVCADSRGNLRFLGRVDDQLSLNGVRIETREIEEALLAWPEIEQATVVLRDDGLGNRLVGYIVGDRKVLTEEHLAYLRQQLRDSLPAPLVPAVLVPLENLPLTDRGKVDRQALPAPVSGVGQGRSWNDMSPEEGQVAEIYAEVTRIDAHEINSESDLFSLGGHSLSAMRVISRLRELGYGSVGIQDIFADSRVSSIAGRCIASPAQESVLEAPSEDSITEAQRRIWFIERAEGPSKLYAIPLVFDFDEPIDERACGEALVDVIALYPSLSSLYQTDTTGNLSPQRLSRQEVSQRFSLLPVEHVDDARQQVRMLPLTIDIGRDLPVRAYYSLGKDMSRLVLVFHHIAVDGWALSALTESLSLAYQERIRGRRLTTVPDYSLPRVQAVTDKDLIWWKSYAQGIPATIDLPSDRVRPNQRDHRGDEVRVRLPLATVQRLGEVCREQGATRFMGLQALTALLLSRCGAKDDIPLGTIVSSRSTPQQEAAVTFAANTVLTRIDTSNNPSFAELISRVRENTGELMAHAHVPFDSVVGAVNPTRSSSHHPLFQVLVIGQNIDQSSFTVSAGHGVVPYIVGTDTAKFDMTFEFSGVQEVNSAETLELRIEYATDIFDAETVNNIAQWWLNLANSLAADPDLRVWELPLDSGGLKAAKQEAQRMLDYRMTHCCAKTESGRVRPAGKTACGGSMSEQLEYVLLHHSSRTALVDIGSDGVRTEVSYRELEELSRVVRDNLLAYGLEVGQRVALLLPRSIYQVAAVLGVVRAGLTYVPLDPEYPLARLNMILEDASVSAVLYRDCDVLDAVDQHLIADTLVVNTSELQPVVEQVVLPQIPSDTAAYIIFTSGSTGRPKGVIIPQRNVIRLLSSTDHWFDFSETDTWVLFHSYAFDFAVWEMFGALLTGGKLVIIPHALSRSPQEFGELLVSERVTVLNQTPSAWRQLVIADELHGFTPLALRVVVLGGEAMDPAVVHRWQVRHPSSECRVINMYGITETTVHVTYQQVNEELEGKSPVGEPIPDLSVYLLDEGGHPVPDGVTGEIHVGGAGLARGYINNEELTNQRFVPDPFARQVSGKNPDMAGLLAPEKLLMYRSGDLAVRLRDGSLDFRGRADRQVQLRGFRIELGELESAAVDIAGITDSVARVIGQRAADQRLVLYVVGIDQMEIDPVQVRKYLAGRVPSYMVPSHVLVVDRLPLTVNGKLDIEALPVPLVKAGTGKAPSSELEKQLLDCFVRVLGIESCSVEDSFFDLGGHSILAVELTVAIEQATGRKVRVGSIMGAPTVELLARLLSEEEDHRDSDLAVMMPLQRGENYSGGAVYCIHPAGGLSWCYSSMTRHIPAEIPVWGVQARGVLEPEKQPQSLARMAADYLAEIRRVHCGGPIHLVGWSLGGMVAQVLGQMVLDSGEDLGVVALLDAYPSEAESGVGEPPLEDAVSAVLAMAGLEDDAVAEDFSIGGLQRALSQNTSPMAGLPAEVIEALTVTYRNTAKILREYAHPVLGSDMLFFSATRAGVGRDHSPHEWDPYVSGSLLVYPIDCTHRAMTQATPMAKIAPVIIGEIQRYGA